MTAVILLTCEAPVGEHGVCTARAPIAAETVERGRELAARSGWWHNAGMGDRCPDHGPRRWRR